MAALFGPLAPSWVVSFVSDKDQIMVAGVVNEPLKIEETRFHVLPRAGFAQALFFTAFDQDGRTKRDAPGGGDRDLSVQLRRVGKGLEVTAGLRGAVTVPDRIRYRECSRPQAGDHAQGQVLKQVDLPKDSFPSAKPNYGKGAMLDGSGATGGRQMLASMMMSRATTAPGTTSPAGIPMWRLSNHDLHQEQHPRGQ